MSLETDVPGCLELQELVSNTWFWCLEVLEIPLAAAALVAGDD